MRDDQIKSEPWCLSSCVLDSNFFKKARDSFHSPGTSSCLCHHTLNSGHSSSSCFSMSALRAGSPVWIPAALAENFDGGTHNVSGGHAPELWGIWRDFQCVLCYPQAHSLNDWSLHDHVASVKHRKGVMLMKGVPDARWEHLWEDDAPPTDFPGHAVPGACMAQERRPPTMFVGSCLATGLGMPQRPPCGGGMPGNFPPPPPSCGAGAASAGACAANPAMFVGDNFLYQQPMFGQPPFGPWMHMHANHFQQPDATWFTSGAVVRRSRRPYGSQAMSIQIVNQSSQSKIPSRLG